MKLTRGPEPDPSTPPHPRARDVTGRRLDVVARVVDPDAASLVQTPPRRKDAFVPRRSSARAIPPAPKPPASSPRPHRRPRERWKPSGVVPRDRRRHRPPPSAEARLHPDHRHRGRLLRVSHRRALPQAQGASREEERPGRERRRGDRRIGRVVDDRPTTNRAPSRRRLDRLPPSRRDARHVRLPRLQRHHPDLPRGGCRDGTVPLGALRQPLLGTRVRGAVPRRRRQSPRTGGDDVGLPPRRGGVHVVRVRER